MCRKDNPTDNVIVKYVSHSATVAILVFRVLSCNRGLVVN